MKILIRFDDICPTMDWIQWEKADSILKTYNIKPLLGVIPNCKDSELQINEPKKDFWNYIRELQLNGYKIAMHGTFHLCDSNKKGLINNSKQSEFAGYPYAIQYEKLKLGKEILESNGIKTDVFFAPSHSYDKNTIKALRSLGFKYLCDGKSNKIINYKGLLAIPVKSFGIPRIKKKGNFVVIFHAHEWTRNEKSIGYEKLKELCKEKHNSIVDFDTYVNQRNGLFVVQKTIESFNVFYSRHLMKIQFFLAHSIKLFLKKIYKS